MITFLHNRNAQICDCHCGRISFYMYSVGRALTSDRSVNSFIMVVNKKQFLVMLRTDIFDRALKKFLGEFKEFRYRSEARISKFFGELQSIW